MKTINIHLSIRRQKAMCNEGGKGETNEYITPL